MRTNHAVCTNYNDEGGRALLHAPSPNPPPLTLLPCPSAGTAGNFRHLLHFLVLGKVTGRFDQVDIEARLSLHHPQTSHEHPSL